MKSLPNCTCLSLIVLIFLTPVITVAEDAAPDHRGGVVKILEQSFSIKMENTHIRDILAHVTSEYALNIMIDNRVVQPKDEDKTDPEAEYVTDGLLPFVNLRDISMADGLQAMLRPLGLAYSVQPNYIWISTLDRIRHESFEDLETRTYSLNGRYVENVNAEKGFETGHKIPVVNLLRHVVPVILEPVSRRPLSYLRADIDKMQIVVHNVPSNHRIVEQVLELTGHKVPDPIPAMSSAVSFLDRPFSINVEKVHLAEVFNRIESDYGVDIVWDERLIRPNDESRVDPNSSYVTDGMIPFVNVRDVTLGAGLGELLQPLGLFHFAHENFIWIASPEHVRQYEYNTLETRFYELPEFVVAKYDSKLGVHTVEQEVPMEWDFFSHVMPFVIDPDSKRLVSFCQYNTEIMQLVVHTTPSNHKLLDSVLQMMEPANTHVASRN